MPSTIPKTILVTGATGKQGGSTIAALLSSTSSQMSSPFNIIAVTRDPTSRSAQSLAGNPHVSVIQGDLSDPNALFSQISTPVWGVFSVQINSPNEEHEGKAFINAAAAHGVRFFVQASGDRGGPAKSDKDATYVKNFQAKFAIEKHLEKVAAASNGALSYYILRPVTFMENLSTDIHGKGFARMWEQMGKEKKLQLVATRDIGWFAARGFLEPERHANTAVTIAGHELTQPEADKIFAEVTGKSMAMTPCLMGSVIKWALKDTAVDMFKWFEEVGYGGNVEDCRKEHPEMMDFGTWLKQCSGFANGR